MKKLFLIAFVFVLGYGYGRWHARGPVPATASANLPARRILYYQDPMHPAYKSDKPGKAPDCGMDLEPVYEGSEMSTEQPSASSIYISQDKQQLIGVRYDVAAYGSAFETLRAPAKVGLDENKVVRVATKLDGWVDTVDVNFVGTHVKYGQELLKIYNPQWQQQFRALVKAKVFGASGQDDAKLAEAKLQLQLIGMDDDEIEMIESARQSNWKLGVYSPIDGVVIERNVVANQKVTPGTLYAIADLSSVWVTADFLESDSASIKVGQAATLTFPSLPGRVFHGKVDSILPQLDPTTRTVKVRMRLANPDYALKPEMYGTVELRTSATRRLMVPQEAVLNSGLKQVVFVDRGNGYLEQREVKLGKQFGDRLEILGGLKAGERIATSGNFLIDSEAQLRAGAEHDRSAD
jgi:RND family efflux transporter MFP subunit